MYRLQDYYKQDINDYDEADGAQKRGDGEKG